MTHPATIARNDRLEDRLSMHGITQTKITYLPYLEFEDDMFASPFESGCRMMILNVANVTDKHKPSTLKILWTEDESKAFLSINNYYHAVFDFRNKAGYCRTGFPESNNSWTKIKERILTDTLIDSFSKSE
ncbi:DUF2251 domain-containing protein [Flectobacillus sp. BAB-3569]|uniref:DUF2251 domain-containing protein n=1 Tax=Flectobacillus sp. BAB-3569 TaxID=1509483 RepID=UPI001C3CBD4C|nr:DUF2251 domain-containing protein [Flectobacillus sp. BAB-3569]